MDSLLGMEKTYPFKTILKHLWSTPCPNLQNWNETFLGLLLLVRAKNFKKQLFASPWCLGNYAATAAFGMNQLIDIPFSMGAMLMMYLGGRLVVPLKVKFASKVRTSSQSTANRLTLLGLERENWKLSIGVLTALTGENILIWLIKIN